MRKRLVLFVGSALLLSGCAVGGVSLRHPTTKQEAQCGPYALKFGVGYQELERCLNDYYRQGYERVHN